MDIKYALLSLEGTSINGSTFQYADLSEFGYGVAMLSGSKYETREYDYFESSVNLDDKSDTATIVLRLYEVFWTCTGEVDPDSSNTTLYLNFRGFEVKTIKPVLNTLLSSPSQKNISPF